MFGLSNHPVSLVLRHAVDLESCLLIFNAKVLEIFLLKFEVISNFLWFNLLPDHLLYVVSFVCINETEFVEVDIRAIIVIQGVVYFTVVFEWHIDATQLKPINKLMKLNSSIKVYIEASEGHSVVFKLLLETLMNDSHKLLHVSHALVLLRNMITRLGRLRHSANRVLDLDKVFEALNFAGCRTMQFNLVCANWSHRHRVSSFW